MKKLATLLIAAAILLGLSQCKKNNIVKHNDGNISSVTSIQQGSDIERILNFNKAVQAHRQNPDLRTRDIVDIEEAADDIADLFNATYTEPTEHYGETERAEFLITLPVNENGKVLLDDVVTAYEELVVLARDNYHASALSDKGYICMIATVEQLSDDEAEIKLIGVYGERTTSINALQDYNPDDSWYYTASDPGLDCDPSSSQGADKILESDLMEYYKIPVPSDIPEGYKLVMTRNRVRDFIGNAFEEWPLFYREGHEANYHCIDGNEMDTLFSNSISVIHYYLNEVNQQPSNPALASYPYQVASLTICGDTGFKNDYYITHHYYVDYGVVCIICEAYFGPAEL